MSLLVLIAAGSYYMRVLPRQSKNRDITSYTVIAESGSLPGLVTASGELQAKRSVNVSPDKQGLLAEVYVEEGDLVKEGDLIGRMDSGDYEYRLNELKAEFEQQKAAYTRRKILFKEGAISAEQYGEYLNLYLSSQARLSQRKVEGNELLIRAPFNGLITNRYAEPGAFVAPTTRASTIAGSTSSSIVELSQGLEVVAKVPESEIGRILIGQDASIRVDAFPEERFLAKVNEISPRALKTDNVTSFEVKLTLIDPPMKLRIGMTTDIDFQTGKTDATTLIPTVAIVTEKGKPGVLVVGPKDQPKFKAVELGTSSGSKTAIINGLNPGNRVFIDLPPWANRKSN